MPRLLCGLALLGILLAGCSSAPKGHSSGYYTAPAQAYTLDLNSAAFRGDVRLTEQCDSKGGSLNIFDSNNRFFRIDYLKINKSPVAMVPSFASERTIADLILNNYLRDVLPKSDSVKRTEVSYKNFVNTKNGDALLGIVSLTMDNSKLPEGTTDANYYYSFLIFHQGDFAYVIQHRTNTYQPDRIKTTLATLKSDMTIPGHLRSESYDNPAVQVQAGKSSGFLGSVLGGGSDADKYVNCN